MAETDYISARVDHAHERLDKMDQRVGILERDYAVTSERMSNIQGDLTEIKGGLRTILYWAIGAVATPIAGAFMVFILKGGLHG